VIGSAFVERDVLIVTCAISAGIHAALTPEHLTEGTGAGAGFLAAAVLLGGLAVALTRRPSAVVLAGTAVVLSGLLAAAHLLWRGRPAVAVAHLQPEGRLT